MRAAHGNLTFGNFAPPAAGGPSAPQVKLDLFLASPFYQWDFQGTQLIGNPSASSSVAFDLTKQSLDPTQNTLFPLFVQYANDHAFWMSVGPNFRVGRRSLATQHEVLLFARDPNEQYTSFATFVDTDAVESAAWVASANVATGAVPDSATLLYPPQANWQFAEGSAELATGGRALTHIPIDPHEFWQSGVTPDVPGSCLSFPNACTLSPPDPAFPVGAGSIKSSRVINKGLCAKFEPYVTGDVNHPGLFEQIQPLFFDALEQGLVANIDHTAVLNRRFDHFFSFVHAPFVRDDAQYGGFFNYWKAEGSVSLGSATLARSDAFWWTLLDGRLSVVPEFHYTDDNAKALDGQLLTPLVTPPPVGQQNTLAEAIWQTANELQVLTTTEPCTQVAPGDERVLVEAPQQTTCSALITNLRSQFTDATDLTSATSAVSIINASLGGTITTNDVSALHDAVFAADVDAANTQSFHNLRCHQPANGCPARPVCQVVIRAKRVNVYPDGVELVFVDDPYEFSNPTLAAWLIAWNGATTTSGQSALAQLCDPPGAQTPGTVSRRVFSRVDSESTHQFVCYCPTATVFPNGNTIFARCDQAPVGLACKFACDATQALCGNRCCNPGDACLDPSNSVCGIPKCQ